MQLDSVIFSLHQATLYKFFSWAISGNVVVKVKCHLYKLVHTYSVHNTLQLSRFIHNFSVENINVRGIIIHNF